MKYALLKYRHSDNIGDEIQSLAAKQYLPRVDSLIERDDFCETTLREPTKLIANGWYSHAPSKWGIMNPHLMPLFISVHCTPAFKNVFTASPSINFLKQFEPIGCRDHYTENLLNACGVDAYFSGCLTLTIKRRNVQNHGKIIISDAGYLRDSVPAPLKENVDFIQHTYTSFQRFCKKLENKIGVSYFKSRLSYADNLLNYYCGAKFVITSRLHCALPCTAMGVPVLYIYEKEKDERLEGLSNIVRCINKKEILRGTFTIPWNDFPLPTNDHINLSKEIEKKVRNFIA